MFFVINKEKVYAYVVSILTIVTLFFMSGVLKTDFEESQELKECYQKIIDKRDNKTTNGKSIVYNTYYNDDSIYTYVKKKVK